MDDRECLGYAQGRADHGNRRCQPVSGGSPSSARMAAECWPTAGTAPMAASRPGTVTGGSIALIGPPGVSTSRHRSRAASCGWAANSCGVRSRALAMPVSSSSAVRPAGRDPGQGALDDRGQLTVVRHPARVVREPSVGDQFRAAQDLPAANDPLPLVLHADDDPAPACAAYGPYGEMAGCRAPIPAPGADRRRRSRPVTHPLAERLQQRHRRCPASGPLPLVQCGEDPAEACMPAAMSATEMPALAGAPGCR